jgi:hypothetical protein
VFQATKKPRSWSATGQVLGRTVGQTIPRQVASPQSLAPFRPARPCYQAGVPTESTFGATGTKEKVAPFNPPTGGSI